MKDKILLITILFMVFNFSYGSVLICVGKNGERFFTNETGMCPSGYKPVSDTRSQYNKDVNLSEKDIQTTVDNENIKADDDSENSYEPVNKNQPKEGEEAEFIENNHKFCLKTCLRQSDKSFDEKRNCVNQCDENKSKALNQLEDKKNLEKLWDKEAN